MLSEFPFFLSVRSRSRENVFELLTTEFFQLACFVLFWCRGMGANGILSLSVNEELEGMIATGEAVILG